MEASTAPFNISVVAQQQRLQPQPDLQESSPQRLRQDATAAADSDSEVVLSDLLVGDVWLATGQSNMVFTVHMAMNGTAEINSTADGMFDYGVRVMSVGQGTSSPTPLDDLKTVSVPWARASPATIGDSKTFSYFSGVAWMFARGLYEALGKGVPIGVVSTNWGGTAVQLWSSTDALSKCDQTRAGRFNPTCTVSKADGLSNSSLYNAMIAPFRPMQAFAGAIWYQGESNVACNAGWGWYKGLNCMMNETACADYYACQFPAMIADWRQKLVAPGADPLPFLFVQLAPYTEGVGMPGDQSTALLRTAQTAALQLPRVGMATAIDHGDTGSPFGNIHPRYKEPVANRLVRAAMAIAYNDADVAFLGPTFASASIASASTPRTVQVSFTADSVGPTSRGGALTLHAAQCPQASMMPVCGWYDVMGSDGAWHNATSFEVATDGSSTLLVTAGASVPTPISRVRYASADWPVATLFNEAGLPAPPFEGAVSPAARKA